MNHINKHYRTLLLAACIMLPAALPAQEAGESGDEKKVTVSGSVQSDVQIPTGHTDADKSNDDVRTNTYAEVNAMSKWVDAGVRFAYLEHPLPGYEADFKGWGVPFYYVKGKFNVAEVTLGTFYDQFGSGFIFRTYEERSLGIDNSILGARVALKPVKGVHIKALTGRQRRYWHHNKAWITGADMELNLDQWIKPLASSNTYVTLGASWVNKHEKDSTDVIYADNTHILNLPTYVNACDVRAQVQHGPYSVLLEYARKGQDPSFDNGYTYGKGYVAMLSASYSKRGLSLLLQAKRSDNFSFRSRRSMSGTSSMLNHLPAFTEDHTYTLAALYPYATHPMGEWAYQAQFGYNFKRRTTLGGRYGMNVKVNFSHVHSLKTTPTAAGGLPGITPGAPGTDGYTSKFWGWGNSTYYQDINAQIERRFSRSFKLSVTYMNQFYNKTIVEGEGGMIHSDIMIADALFNLGAKTTLRTELQYLATKDDDGDWLFALAELSLAPHWMLTVSDEYNSGKTGEHYPGAYVTYNVGAHRLQAGWARTKAGYNCSGGVCRYVPETKGVVISYNYNF